MDGIKEIKEKEQVIKTQPRYVKITTVLFISVLCSIISIAVSFGAFAKVMSMYINIDNEYSQRVESEIPKFVYNYMEAHIEEYHK